MELTKTLTLSNCKDGFWLYDKTRGMNLSMKAKTKDEAFIEALTYYQERLKKIETHYSLLAQKVYSFVDSVKDEE